LSGPIVAGFDLSFTMAAAVWLDEDFNVVDARNSPIKPGPLRLKRALRLFYSWLQTPTDLAIIEDNAYGAPSRVVVVKLSQLNTLMKLVCEASNVPWLEVAPGKMKRFITGKGTAEKGTVAQELQRKWGIVFVGEEKRGYDLTDAAGLAVWGVHHETGMLSRFWPETGGTRGEEAGVGQ